ncbi:MAG: hypothetical protein A3J97_00575 [Spirochaetes bacterium RIFOXYC1_FULL_54_7]|nr:MAG: hypothetical protein A3J97_00575 [Spirochaetes bacterium RIFOXYC1_FULL_54_7]
MLIEKDRVLAVDIGTSSVRAMVFDAGGTILARTQICYPTLRPQPYYEEQDPDLVRRETYRAIAECLAQVGAGSLRVGGIAFSSQMYGIFPVDIDGRALCFNILWSDGRAGSQAESLKGKTAFGSLYASTGCPANSIYPLAKLLWLREERPAIFEQAARFVSIKEYVLAPLVGEWIVDHSMASATGLLDITKRCWSEVALTVVGLDASRLSLPVLGDVAFPFVDADLRRSWGLADDVRIFSGGGDGPLANVGSGAFEVGSVNIDLGTSGAARVVVDRPTVDSEGSLWCYCLSADRWTYGGIVTNVGNAYQWLASNIVSFGKDESPEAIFTRLNTYAAAVVPGAEGVRFLPYLRKARSPYWDDRLTGTVFGLGADHDLRHLARALLEAIAYDIAVIVDLMADQVELKPTIILTGGLSRNPLVAQLLADILDRQILVPDCNEGSVAGAAVMGFHGLGISEGLAFVRGKERNYASWQPDTGRSALYHQLRAEYSDLVSRFRVLGAELQATREARNGVAGGQR